MLQAVPASDVLFSSGSSLPTTTAELSLLSIASVTKAKNLSDGHGILDVGEGGLLAAVLPPDVTKDGNGVTENGAVYDASLILVAGRKSKVVYNERDHVASQGRNIEARQSTES